jgi:diguanylate cyclase (GGDEF)-like protein
VENEREYLGRELFPADITEEEAMRMSHDALVAHTLQVQADRRRVATTDQKLETMLIADVILRQIHERIGQRRAFGLFYIDLDNFKRFNDTYDHLEGDELLRLLERLFNETFHRSNDAFRLARMGGDEFLLLIADLEGGGRRSSNPVEQMSGINVLLRTVEGRLLEAEPRARAAGVGFSIGQAVYDPEDPVDAIALIKQSEASMYKDKADRHETLRKRGLYTER